MPRSLLEPPVMDALKDAAGGVLLQAGWCAGPDQVSGFFYRCFTPILCMHRL